MTAYNHVAAWTEEEINSLKELWPDKAISATQIGITIGRPRNGVIGKAHRLGLPHRDPSRARVLDEATGQLMRKKPKPNWATGVMPRRIRRRLDPNQPNLPIIVPEPQGWAPIGVCILEATHHHCRAVINSTGSGAGLATYCGHHVPPGRILKFCDVHHQRFTMRPKRMR